MAKVMAMYKVKVDEWDKTRDYFTAFISSSLLAKQGQTIDPRGILKIRYPEEEKTVIITSEHDPDFGAQGGEWLRESLKRRAT